MLTVVIISLAGALALSITLTLLVRSLSRRFSFVDRPGGHKGHEVPVALGGGIAIYLAICGPVLVGTLVARAIDPEAPPGWVPPFVVDHLGGIASKTGDVVLLVLAATVLFAVGLVDDIRALGAWPKLAVQVLTAFVIAGPAGIRLGEALPPAVSVVLTVVWLVAITNAFNFLDNMDGLSAGVAAICAAVFALAAGGAGQVFVPVFAWILVGACIGFVFFNFAPASIYMGDAGSLLIGFLVGVLTVLTTYFDPRQGRSPLGVLVPVIVLAVPLYDVISVVIHRLRAGESPFRGDQRHFSHRLVRRGMSPRVAVITIYLATAATALPAVALPRADWLTASLLLAECVAVVAMIAVLEHVGRGTGETPKP